MACDGRGYEGLQKALGPFSKYLPLRCRLDGKLRFCEMLRRVNESAGEALEWQEYFNWEHIAGSNGNLKATPFCAVSFEFQEQPARYSAADLTLSIRQQHACTDRFKLKLCCVSKENSLVVELHYDANLFRAVDIERLNEQLLTLLESVLRNPETAISELAILSTAEREQLLVEFNDTKTDYPEDKCIHQLFEEQVERTPDNVAVVFEGSATDLRSAQRSRQSTGPSPAIAGRRTGRAGGHLHGALPGDGRRGFLAFSKPAAPSCRWTRRIPRSVWPSCCRMPARRCC